MNRGQKWPILWARYTSQITGIDWRPVLMIGPNPMKKRVSSISGTLRWKMPITT